MKHHILVRLILRIGPAFWIEKRVFAPVVEAINGSSIDLRLAGGVSLKGLAAKFGLEGLADTMLGLLGDCTMRAHKEAEAKYATDRGGEESLVGQPMQRGARKGCPSGNE